MHYDLLLELLSQTPFIVVMNELTVNAPKHNIVQIADDDRARIHMFEWCVARLGTSDLLLALAPRHITNDEERIINFIASLKTCVKRRHPSWPIKD